MKSNDITIDELLAELEKPGVNGDGFRSTKELVTDWGVTDERRVREILHRANDVGRLEVRKVSRKNIEGISVLRTCYRIKPAAKAKAKKK